MPIVEGEREQLNMTATPKNTSEQDPYQYYAEASDLGFPPGKWPHILESEIGNSQPFTLHHSPSSTTDFPELRILPRARN